MSHQHLQSNKRPATHDVLSTSLGPPLGRKRRPRRPAWGRRMSRRRRQARYSQRACPRPRTTFRPQRNLELGLLTNPSQIRRQRQMSTRLLSPRPSRQSGQSGLVLSHQRRSDTRPLIPWRGTEAWVSAAALATYCPGADGGRPHVRAHLRPQRRHRRTTPPPRARAAPTLNSPSGTGAA